MLEMVLNVLIGLSGGIAVGTQVPLSGVITQRVGGAASSFIIHAGGAIASGLLLLMRGGENIGAWRSLPWYALGSGALGLVLYLTLSHTLPRLGATSAVTLIIVGQLLTGVLIDSLGWFGSTVRALDGTRVLAIGLLLVGCYLIVSGN